MAEALIPSGVQIGAKYVLTGPDGTRAVFNDNSDPDFVGAVSDIPGLDSAEVRENGENISGQDGGVHGDFFEGRRPITIVGTIYNVVSPADRNKKITKLQQATNALRGDAILEWTPEGGEPSFIKIRRQQPLRIKGGWDKEFQVQMVAADPKIYSVSTKEATAEAEGVALIGTGTEPKGIAISPDGKHVYVTNFGSNTVSQYARNTATGALTALGTPTIATGTGPRTVIVSPDGKNVYVVNKGANTISRYNRNTSTGELASQGAAVASGPEPIDIAFSNNEKFFFVTNFGGPSISIYERTTTTTTLLETASPIGEAGSGIYKITKVFATTNAETGDKISVMAASFYTKGAIMGLQFNETTKKFFNSWLMFPPAGTKFTSIAVRDVEPTELWTRERVKLLALDEATGKLFICEFEASPETIKGGTFTASTEAGGNLGFVYNKTSKRVAVVSSTTNKVVIFDAYTLHIVGSAETAVSPFGITETEVGIHSGYVTNITGKSISTYSVGSTGVWAPSYPGVGGTASSINSGSAESIPTLVAEVSVGVARGLWIANETTGEQLSLSAGVFSAGTKIEINVVNRTIYVNGANAFSLLDLSLSSWWTLAPGANVIKVSAGLAPGSKVKIKVVWKNAWA